MKKYIVFALIALFAAVLFIACDNDVKVDNSVAFTQRIASEGAFVVNGKSYDSLQAAINAATGAKMPAPDPVKITLTKDYAGRAVSIPEDAQVAIDLNGHTLTFVDLKETTPALSVEEGAYFALGNGTVTILDKTEGLTLIAADDAYYVVLASVNADLADGQNAIAAIDTHVYLVQNEDADPTCVSGNIFLFGSDDNKASLLTFEDTVVLGSVTAVGEHAAGDEYSSDVALIVHNALSDVRMTNTYIDVSSTGHVTLNALAGENRFEATKGSSSITNNTDVLIEVYGGLYSITRGESSRSYYGSLQEALNSLDEDNLVIVLRDNDDSTNPVVASNGKSFTIVLSGNYEPGYGIHATSITADADMEIVNSGYSNSVIYSEIYGDIDVAGKFVVTGYYYDRIHIDGTVTAGEVTADYAVFGDDINSSGAVEVEDCLFYEAPSITTDGNISINSSYGFIGDIVASGAINLSTPEVNAVEYQLTVGAVNASSNKVTINGNNVNNVIVNGAVTAGEVTADYAVFGDDIFATTAAKLTNSYVGNEEVVGVFASEIKISGSTLNVDYLQGTEGAPATSVRVTESTGTIGTIVASDSTATTPVITLSTPEVNNTAVEDPVAYKLTVGAVNASSNYVSITGHTHVNVYNNVHETVEDYVIVNGAVTAGDVVSGYAVFSDTVTAGNMDAYYVTFSKAVTASEVTAYYAEFGDDIFATTAAKLINSNVGNGDGDGVFAPEIEISGSTLDVNYLQGAEAGAPATSVSVTESTGTIGTIVASNSTATTPVITLSTPEVNNTAQLTVGAVNASSNNVTINGHIEDYVIVNGKVSCATLYANNASFDDSSRVEASELTGGYYYGTVILSGSDIIDIASGDYENVVYNGTGTLNIIGGTIYDIDNITDNVNIKGGTIYEPEIYDLAKVVNRINQDSSGQNVEIHFNPTEKVFLTGYEPFDMTSANIAGTASLVFDMKFVSGSSSNDIVSGLIVGQAPSASASVVFDSYNGPGKKQISVSGRIGLYGGSKIYSTQQTDALVYTATEASTENTYKLADPSTAITGVTTYSGYEYANQL